MRSKLKLFGIPALVLSAIALSPFNSMAADSVKSLEAGAKWEVGEKTTLTQLIIAEGASITTPEGKSLTMTVDGVETSIRPGTYQGNVVLTPAKEIPVLYNEMGSKALYKYRAGVYVDNGVYDAEKSVPAAVVGGSVTGQSADNVKITSAGDQFNGIVVNGKTNYTINNPQITLTGNGKNDFSGVGAGIRVAGSSKVVINNAKIKNTGVVRTTIWVGNDSDVTINDSEIEANDGIMPKDYGYSWVKPPTEWTDVMMQVPWMLGTRGNNRGTIVVGNGTAHYNNSHIRSEGWGAMSTDGEQNRISLFLTKCHVETVKNGYGAYVMGNTVFSSSGTTFDVADYGAIMAGGRVSGGYATFTDGSEVNSRRIGIMAHSGYKNTLTIDKGSVFNTEKAVIQLKESTPTIVVDNAELNSKSGLILQLMANDDPYSGPAIPKMTGPIGVVNASFKDVKLQGDFVNSLTAQAGMNLAFENSTLIGAITTATAAHATGPNGEKLVMQDATDLYYLIGEETETYTATDGAFGATVSLKAGSKWLVNKTSYLTGLTVADSSNVSAPAGYTVTMAVNGTEKPITVGTYAGKIVLTVTAK